MFDRPTKREPMRRVAIILIFIFLLVGALWTTPENPSTHTTGADQRANAQSAAVKPKPTMLLRTQPLTETASSSFLEPGTSIAGRISGGSPIPTTTTTTVPISDATSVATTDWQCIRKAESTGSGPWWGNYSDSGGGAYQFEEGTWYAVTGLTGSAESYPQAVQDSAALVLYAQRGWKPWIADRHKCPSLF